VRFAVGGGRTRIVGPALAGGVIVLVFGRGFGVLFRLWGGARVLFFVSSNQPRPLGFATGVDLRVLGFTVAISLLTGILFGIAPAFRSVRMNLTPALKEGEGSSASSGHAGGKWFSIGNALVVA